MSGIPPESVAYLNSLTYGARHDCGGHRLDDGFAG
jgi:hypothetical protein